MVKLKTIQMTDEELIESKLQLAHYKMQKDETDLNLEEMEKQLESKLATKLLNDDIDRLKEDIKSKKTYDVLGNKVDTTEADLIKMEISLEKLKGTKKLDLPSRKLRQSINQLRDAKTRADAPELQIKKLEKNIRSKSYQITDTGRVNPMTN